MTDPLVYDIDPWRVAVAGEIRRNDTATCADVAIGGVVASMLLRRSIRSGAEPLLGVRARRIEIERLGVILDRRRARPVRAASSDARLAHRCAAPIETINDGRSAVTA
jgi:hypothetical protein